MVASYRQHDDRSSVKRQTHFIELLSFMFASRIHVGVVLKLIGICLLHFVVYLRKYSTVTFVVYINLITVSVCDFS